LTRLLGDHLASSLARIHAIWALDAIDTGRASRAAIITVLNDRDPAVASQAMRQLGTRRVLEAAEPLVAQLRHSNALVRFHAATALGRIANPATMPSLQDALNERDSFARFAVFTALNRLGRTHPQSWSAIAEGLENSNPAIREGTAFALRETYDPLLVSALSITARDRTRPSTARATALQLLAALHRKAPEWRGEWWAYHPVNSPPPAKSVAWAATPSILSVLRQQLFDPDVTVRRAAVVGLRETADPASAGVLRGLLATEEDIGLRCAIVETLGDLRDREAIPPIALLLNTPGQNRAVLASAVAAAGRIGSTEFCTALTHLPAQVGDNPQLLSRVITTLGTLKCPQAVAVVAAQVRHSDDAVRQAAFQSLARIRGPATIEALMGLLDDPSPELRRGAMAALGACKSQEAVAPLLQMYQDQGMRPDAIAALALMPDARAVDAYLDGLGGKNASSRDACRKAITAIRSQALPGIEKRLGQLSPAVIAELKKIYRDAPSARQSALFTSLARLPELADYSAFVIKNPGDPLRGKAVFIDPSGVGCAKCHAVGGQGGNVGPDLSSIGAQFSQAELIESVLYPSKSVREGYQQFTIETKDGEEWSGLLRTETNEELTLQEGNGALQRVRKADLKSRRGSSLSLMPEGLHAGLSLQEFADLIAYLESLKGQGSERRNP
jgi:putative heme-binding domain-containing protein